MKMSLCILFFIFSLNALAGRNPELEKLFKNDFKKNYIQNQCGSNILNFLKRAEASGMNLYNANILEISNKGFSLFGLINAEYAREAGRLNPNSSQDGLRQLPGESNWYHHVVLELDGEIYDFDFGNRPSVLAKEYYFEKMFLNDKKKSEGGEHYIGREEKMKTYEILVRPGLDTLRAREERRSSPVSKTLRLKDYLY
jgi:hypothetical protein